MEEAEKLVHNGEAEFIDDEVLENVLLADGILEDTRRKKKEIVIDFDPFDFSPNAVDNISEEMQEQLILRDAIGIFDIENCTVKVFVQIAVAADARFEEEGPNQIKSAIMTYINGLGVGNDVVLSALYGHIHSINGVVEVTGLKLKTEGDSEYKAESITIGEVAIAVTTANEIEVTIENETVQL